MSFYLRMSIAVKNSPNPDGVKAGDIISVHAFDDWDARPVGGIKVRKSSLLVFLQVPDKIRNKVNRLHSMQLFSGTFTDTLGDPWDDPGYLVVAKRRINIPKSKMESRWPGLMASVDWQRLRDFDDEYQPFFDRLFVMTATMQDFLWCKFRNTYLTDGMVDLDYVIT